MCLMKHLDFIRKPTFDFDSFEPYLSSEVIRVHFEDHHCSYMKNINSILFNDLNNWNEFIKDCSKIFEGEHSLAEIFSRTLKKGDLESVDLNTFIFICSELTKHFSEKNMYKKLLNNALQVFNHNFFWQSMRLNNVKDEILNHDIVKSFIKEANDFFGSGWVWIIFDEFDEEIKVVSTPNAKRPENCKYLLVIDLWEHAYYLQFRSRRASFIQLFVEKLANFDLLKIALNYN